MEQKRFSRTLRQSESYLCSEKDILSSFIAFVSSLSLKASSSPHIHMIFQDWQKSHVVIPPVLNALEDLEHAKT